MVQPPLDGQRFDQKPLADMARSQENFSHAFPAGRASATLLSALVGQGRIELVTIDGPPFEQNFAQSGPPHKSWTTNFHRPLFLLLIRHRLIGILGHRPSHAETAYGALETRLFCNAVTDPSGRWP